MSDRIEKLRAALAEAACGAFVSFSPPANEYLAAFRGSASALIVTRREAIFLCDFRYTEQANATVQGFEVHEVTGTLETRAGEWLTQLGAPSAGFDPAVLTVHQLNTLRDAFSGELRPLDAVLTRLRWVKSPDEVDRLRAASALGESVLIDVFADLKEGVLEREVAAQIGYELRRRGAQGVSFDPIVLFGARSSLPHGVPGAKPLEHGDIVLIDMGCILESYCSDLTRTAVFGTIPPAWFQEIYEVTLRAQLAALEAVRPGAACVDVDDVARATIRDAGFGDYFGHGLGHGVGLEIHEAPRLNMQSKAVLEPGMAVTIEPGIYLPGKGGVRIEDLVVVTTEGCEILTKSPKELRVLHG